MDHIARFALFIVIACPVSAAIAVGCSGDSSSGGAQSTGSASAGSSGTASTGAGGVGGAGGEGIGGAASSSSSSSGVGAAPTHTAECQGKIYLCGDLIDNDGDMLVDSQDPDCLGSCDNTEDSFYGGIPGQAGPACTVDCYFDNDSGSGNDDCHWNHQCDPNEVDPKYYPEPENGAACKYDPNANTPGTGSSCSELNMAQSQTCYDICAPLTPNGCDCFGCCELPWGSGKFVFLGSVDLAGKPSCRLDDLEDPDKCHPCKPVDACLNGCGVCELCVGKDELPPECYPDGGSGSGGAGGAGSTQCEDGAQPCGLAGQDPCPEGKYCLTGCCRDVLL